MTIVLADHDAITRGRLKRRLEKIKGLVVIGEATQPEEATAMIINRKPDIVILDTELQYGGGIDVLRHIKHHFLHPTIIMVTTHPSEELRDACAVAGADFFFDKSMEDRKVIDTIRLFRAPERENDLIILQAQESERRRISRELHDELGQILTGLKFDVAWLQKHLVRQPPSVRAGSLIRKTESISASVDALVKAVRNTAASLRPPILDEMGLLPALEWLVTEFQTHAGIQCKLNTVADPSCIRTTTEASTALFRMVQELLTNVRRHAKATSVSVRLHEYAGNLMLEVADNGTGVLPEDINKPGALGIRGIQERVRLLGGAMTMIGRPDAGTTVRIMFPSAVLTEPDGDL